MTWLVLNAVIAWCMIADEEPPLVGRPANYAGAIGDFRSITASANPVEIEAESPVTLVVRIAAAGPVKQPPSRPDLRTRAEFLRTFVVEDLADSDQSHDTWEFRYRLRPLTADVTEIPAIRFDYFRPAFVPPEKGYQTRYSDAIPVKVLPSPPALLDETTTPPETAFQIEHGVAILRHDEPYAVPWNILLTAAIATPLTISAYCVWRSRRSSWLAVSLLVVGTIHADEPASDVATLERAEVAFYDGVRTRAMPRKARPYFAAAAGDYETLRQRGFTSPALLRNEGNAWLLAGDKPRAIFAFRLALQLDPSDQQSRANLQFARARVNQTTQPERAWNWTIAPAIWIVAAIGGYVAAWLFLSAWWFRGRRSSVYGALASAALAGLAVGVLVGIQRQQDLDKAYPVVVINADDVMPRAGDGSLYPASANLVLHRGAEARLLHRHGDWLQIEFADGIVGWVHRGQALVANSPLASLRGEGLG